MGKSNSKPDQPSIEQSGVITASRNSISETYIERVSIGEICGVVAATAVVMAVLVMVVRQCWKKFNKRVDQRIRREVAKSCEMLAVSNGSQQL